MTRKALLSFLILFASVILSAQTTKRVEEDFDFDWKFSKVELPEREYEEIVPGNRPGQPPVPGNRRQSFRRPKERVDMMLPAEKGLELPSFDDSSWEIVQTPHDWNIKDKFDTESSGSAASLPEGIGWYRKVFKVPASMKNSSVTILFDGIFQKSDVYINGHHLGTHPYGFTSVYYDLTPYIKYGEDNLIAVRSSTVGGRPRWYAGGGIYRHVKLIYTNPVHVDVYGTYVTTPEVSESKAVVSAMVTVANDSQKDRDVRISHQIKDKTGKVIASAQSGTVSAKAGRKTDVSADIIIDNPVLWDVDNPEMYTLLSIVKSAGKEVDRYETPFGVRTFSFDVEKGFILNGRQLKLKGVAIHQDAGGLGAAVPDRSYERRLEILKEYGANAIRMAHNQPSKEVLDMCDRMGFIVIDEALDKWKSGYYEALYDEWWQKDVADMILRDRNHPSIVMWSIGNEVSEALLEDNTGVEMARTMQDFVHELEPTRPVNIACQNNHKAHFAGVPDVTGYNYLEARAIAEHKLYPDRKMLITEELPYWCGEEGNIRSYTPINPWNLVMENDFIAGGFIWSGVDYLGEASNPSRGWPNGLFDICMFEKPRASYHRAMWSDTPVVRVAVRDSGLDQDFGRDIWQWPATKDDWTYPSSYRGRMMDIETVTNCEEVELYHNDKKMGRHLTSDFTNNTIIWHLPYNPGTLKAVGYIGGEAVAEYSIHTTGEIVDFTIASDRDVLSADGQDLSHLTVTLVDDRGHRVQIDEREVSVSVKGEGRLLAVDSGELRVESDSFARSMVKTQFGRALAIVQSGRRPGAITVTVSVQGVGIKEYTLESR